MTCDGTSCPPVFYLKSCIGNCFCTYLYINSLGGCLVVSSDVFIKCRLWQIHFYWKLTGISLVLSFVDKRFSCHSHSFFISLSLTHREKHRATHWHKILHDAGTKTSKLTNRDIYWHVNSKRVLIERKTQEVQKSRSYIERAKKVSSIGIYIYTKKFRNIKVVFLVLTYSKHLLEKPGCRDWFYNLISLNFLCFLISTIFPIKSTLSFLITHLLTIWWIFINHAYMTAFS